MSTPENQLKQLAGEVYEFLNAQKLYFKTRNGADLISCKRLERNLLVSVTGILHGEPSTVTDTKP